MTRPFTIAVADGDFDAYRIDAPDPSAAVIVLLHELFGVNEDMRVTAHELAARHFTVLVPDLFWRQEAGVDLDVRSERDWKKGLELYTHLDRQLAVEDICAVLAQARQLDGARRQIATLGYCLGGLLSFLVASRSSIDAAVAYHGADTEKYLDQAKLIEAPFLMHLAGEDEFMPPLARQAIVEALAPRSNFQVFTYPGCNHAFSRHGGLHYDAAAAALSHDRTAAFLKRWLV